VGVGCARCGAARWIWNLLRKLGLPGQAAHLKGCHYALWKNPDTLTDRQAAELAWIARHHSTLYRASLQPYGNHRAPDLISRPRDLL
jgi:hypothetical protein